MFPGPLRAFHETVVAGSMRRAGEKLGLAPSSIGRQIAVLERMMGTVLLKRVSHGIELTHAGEMVAEYARSVVMDFDTLRLDLDDLKGRRGLIRVAMVESIVSGGPVEAAARFRRTYESVSFEFQIMPASRIVESLGAKTSDIGIGFCTEPSPHIVHEARIIEPLILAIHPNHPLACRKSVKLADIQDVPLALPDANFGVRRLVDKLARELNLNLAPVLVANSFEALRDFCRLGAGATILPRRAASSVEAHAGLAAIEFVHPEFQHTTLDLIRLTKWRMPRIVRLYLDVLRDTLAPSTGEID
jgi:DNA-binding transcriptional LysR family regulator